jgi:hypothetical protein
MQFGSLPLLLFSFFGWVLFLSSGASFALAAPTAVETTEWSDLVARKNPAPPKLADIPNSLAAGQPAANKCLFFTGQDAAGTAAIKAWGATAGLATVGSVWKTGNTFTDKTKYDATKAVFRQFQQDFSRVYAQHTSGTAYLLITPGAKPRSDSIFYSIELEEMIKGGKVDKIIRLDMTADHKGPANPTTITTVYWKKGDPKPPAQGTGGTDETK